MSENEIKEGITRKERQVLFGLVAFSFLISLIILSQNPRPRMVYKAKFADHVSHQYTTIVFYHLGREIYKYPINQLLAEDRSKQAYQFAKDNDVPITDVFDFPIRLKKDQPVFVNWPKLARVYPPGIYLFFLPEALFLEYTDAPGWMINFFSIAKFSFVAHLLLWFFLSALICQWNIKLFSWSLRRNIFLMVAIIVWVQICFWPLAGFYDEIAILFVVLMVCNVQKKRLIWAIFFFSIAVFFHFRSLWYFPLLIVSSVECLKKGSLKNLIGDWRQIPLLAVGTVILGISAYFFLLAYSSMKAFPVNNPLLARNLRLVDKMIILQLCLILILILIIAVQKKWYLLSGVLGALFFLLNTPQVQSWHTLFLLPLLLCYKGHSCYGIILSTASYCVLCYCFFDVIPFYPIWLLRYFHLA